MHIKRTSNITYMTDYIEPHTVSAVFTFKNTECKENS